MDIDFIYTHPSGELTLVVVLVFAVAAGLLAPKFSPSQALITWAAAVIAAAAIGYWEIQGQVARYAVDGAVLLGTAVVAVGGSLWLGRVLGRRKRFGGPASRSIASIVVFITTVVLAVTVAYWAIGVA